MPDDKLLIRSQGTYHVLKKTDIILITRVERKTVIYTEKHGLESNYTLSFFESNLGDRFFRCHEGYIINIDYVSGMQLYGKKTYTVKLHNTEQTALMTFEKMDLFKKNYCSRYDPQLR